MSVSSLINSSTSVADFNRVVSGLKGGAMETGEKRKLHFLIGKKAGQLLSADPTAKREIKAAMKIAHRELGNCGCAKVAGEMVTKLKAENKDVGEMLEAFLEGTNHKSVESFTLDGGKFTLKLSSPIKKVVYPDDFPEGVVMMLGTEVKGKIKNGAMVFDKGFDTFLKTKIPKGFEGLGKIPGVNKLVGKKKSFQITSLGSEKGGIKVTVDTKIPLVGKKSTEEPFEKRRVLWAEGVPIDDESKVIQ